MNKNIAETKIKGLKIYMNENYVTIMDSYKILNKNKMSIILDKIKQKENYFFSIDKRTKKSLISEWSARNRLYKMHILRKYTKNCIFKNNINPILDILYQILGFSRGERIWKKKKKKLPLSLELYMMLIKISFKLQKKNFLKELLIVKKKKSKIF